MTPMEEFVEKMNALLATVPPTAQDAIDRVLAGDARVTAAWDVRSMAVFQSLRNDLDSGLIGASGVNRTLDAVNRILGMVLPMLGK